MMCISLQLEEPGWLGLVGQGPVWLRQP